MTPFTTPRPMSMGYPRGPFCVFCQPVNFTTSSPLPPVISMFRKCEAQQHGMQQQFQFGACWITQHFKAPTDVPLHLNSHVTSGVHQLGSGQSTEHLKCSPLHSAPQKPIAHFASSDLPVPAVVSAAGYVSKDGQGAQQAAGRRDCCRQRTVQHLCAGHASCSTDRVPQGGVNHCRLGWPGFSCGSSCQRHAAADGLR